MCPAGGLLPSIASNEHEIEVRERETKKKNEENKEPQTLLMGLFFYMSCFLTG